MKDPIRLLDDPELSGDARELLALGDPTPAVPDGERRRMKVFVAGITAGTIGVSSLLTAKLALAALAVAGVAGTVWIAAQPSSAPDSADPTEQRREAEEVAPSVLPEVPLEETRVPPEETVEEPSLEPPDPELTTPEPQRQPEGPRTDEAPVDALAAEVAMLERARALLRSNPRAALAEAERSRRLHRNGQLRDERELIAVDALIRLGRRRQAERRAQALISRNPNGMYARRAQRLIGGV